MSSAQAQKDKCASLWIHCNRCFENYTEKQRTIFILSCYDVACEKCITIVNKNEMKCLICKQIVKGQPIGNNLKPNLKELFHPRPWTLSFVKTCFVFKFQIKQRNHFLLGCKKLKEFDKSLEMERDRVKEECKQMFLYQEKQKKEKARLAAGLKKLKELSASKKYAYRGLDESHHSSDFLDEMQLMNKRNDNAIPSTYHVTSRSRTEDTFNYPVETSLSKSFYL